MKIQIIDIKDIDGFKIGNAEDINNGTGCTVIISEEGAVGGVDVRGGGPATRETDLLRSENTVNAVNAVVLSGGSAFGLEAASGVMRELSDRGIGFDVEGIRVPIVCGASLFDLSVGDGTVYPDMEMGKEAVRNAYEGVFEHGNRGAGTGASVGKFKGMNRAMKTGLGTFACGDEYVQVGAVVAVNAIGDVYNGAGNIMAGLRTEDGNQIYGTIKTLKSLVHNYSAPVYDDTDVVKKAERDTQSYNKAEIANAIKNAFTGKNIDSAVMHEKSGGNGSEESNIGNSSESIDSITDFYTSEMMVTGRYSRERINQAMQEENDSEDSIGLEEIADSENRIEDYVEDNINETDFRESESASVSVDALDDEPDLSDVITVSDVLHGDVEDEDMGYDISFNTTIACIITNAILTKPQANKLASILHDAYARAIKPVHSTLDGDTVFVLSSGISEVNFDAFAALATDVLQYAIIDAASSAKSAYGLPASCDIIRK